MHERNRTAFKVNKQTVKNLFQRYKFVTFYFYFENKNEGRFSEIDYMKKENSKRFSFQEKASHRTEYTQNRTKYNALYFTGDKLFQ